MDICIFIDVLYIKFSGLLVFVVLLTFNTVQNLQVFFIDILYKYTLPECSVS